MRVVALVLVAACLSGCAASAEGTGTGSVASRVLVGGQPYDAPVLTFQEIRNRQLLRQKYDFTCGSAALATILRYQYDDTIAEQDIIRDVLASGKSVEEAKRVGFSLLDLKQFLERRGYQARGLGGMETAGLMRYKTPAIVAVNVDGYKHFVVVRDVRDGVVYLANPALGNQRLPAADFEKIWQGRIAFYALPAGGPEAVAENRMAAIAADEASVDFGETLVQHSWQDTSVLRYSLEDRLRIAR